MKRHGGQATRKEEFLAGQAVREHVGRDLARSVGEHAKDLVERDLEPRLHEQAHRDHEPLRDLGHLRR